MSTTDNGRTEARSRADRRLRRVTIGTAILGVAATGTLGFAAAAGNDGSAASSATTAAVTSAATDTASDTATDTAIDDTDDVAAATPAPSVAGSSGSAHASTGGS
jgi:hypothetical protein